MLENPEFVLLYADEFSFSNTATLNYCWSERGVQPKISCKDRNREQLTVFVRYNYHTGQIIINFKETGNSNPFNEHLKKVLHEYHEYRDTDKIIMVLDNVRYHHAKKTAKWIGLHPKLEFIFFPSDSPELNPKERVWWYMRKKIIHNRFME